MISKWCTPQEVIKQFLLVDSKVGIYKDEATAIVAIDRHRVALNLDKRMEWNGKALLAAYARNGLSALRHAKADTIVVAGAKAADTIAKLEAIEAGVIPHDADDMRNASTVELYAIIRNAKIQGKTGLGPGETRAIEANTEPSGGDQTDPDPPSPAFLNGGSDE